MQKDVEAQQKLLGCITPMDVMAWQAEVLQSAYSDYALHSKRMMDLISSVAGAPPIRFGGQTKRDYNDVPV